MVPAVPPDNQIIIILDDSLSESLEIIKQLSPKRAYLTHISHQMGLHHDVNEELPQGISLAYDGLRLEI